MSKTMAQSLEEVRIAVRELGRLLWEDHVTPGLLRLCTWLERHLR